MAEFARSTAVPHLESRRSCRQNRCYRAHAHDGFSIGLIEAGDSVLAGPLEGAIRLEPGDIALIPAGQVHACNPDLGAWRYQMTHLDQRWAADLAPRDAHALFSGISVLRRDDLPGLVRETAEAVFEDAPRDRVEAAFAALLRELASASPAHRIAGRADAELLQRLAPAMRRLREDEANPPLAELAELVGMTKYRLVRSMRAATGLSPLAWRQNARIIRARRLLREGRPIADIAHDLRFADQSHFHRVFRAHVAASPGAYRG